MEMRTVMVATRTAIHANGFSKRLWAEAANYAVFTLNQTRTSSVDGKTPAQLWFGRQVDINKLRAFGCESYVLTPSHKKGEMDRKSERRVLVGYEWDSPCYRIYFPSTGKIVSSEDVIFHEARTDAKSETELSYANPPGLTDEEKEQEEKVEKELQESTKERESEKPTERNDRTPSGEQASARELRDRNNLKQPTRLIDYVMDPWRRGNIAHCAMIGEVQEISVEACWAHNLLIFNDLQEG